MHPILGLDDENRLGIALLMQRLDTATSKFVDNKTIILSVQDIDAIYSKLFSSANVDDDSYWVHICESFLSKTQLEKSFFPYEYLDCFERLDERSLPPYNSFVSSLKQGQNTLEIRWNRFMSILRDLQQQRNHQRLVDSEIEALKILKWKNKPLTGK